MYIISVYVSLFISINELRTSHVTIKIDIQRLNEKTTKSSKK